MPLPPLPVTTVGSLPRSPELLRALKARRRGDLDRAGFDAVADAAVRDAVALQTAAGSGGTTFTASSPRSSTACGP